MQEQNNYTVMICHRIFHSLLILFAFSMLTSCDQIETVKRKQAVKHNYNKVVDFDWNRLQLLPDTVIENGVLNHSPVEIVSQIDRTLCGECLSRYLHFAEKYVSSYKSDSICFIAIISTDRQKEVRTMISDIDPIKVKVLYDVDGRYLKDNNLWTIDGVWNVFLLNGEQRIVLMGDPLTQEKMQPLYKKEITKLLKKSN